MATDFSYNNKIIAASGPFKPTGKDMPVDARTRVETYADIVSIPNPHVGLKITVKVDETNDNKMTDYIVKSLKANSMGNPNSVIDEVVRYADYLGVSSSGGGTGSSGNVDLTGYATETYVDNAIDAALDGHTFRFLTQAEYDVLETKDPLVEYHITDATDVSANYYTKPEIDEKIENAVTGNVDLTSYASDLTLSGDKLQLKNKNGVLIGSSVTLPSSGGSSDGITSITLTGYTAPSYENIYEFEEVGNEYMTASDNKTFNKTANEFLSEWYDIYAGLQSDGMLVTKSLIGYDQTNTYPVYEYDFKPKNYNRTILITSGLHSYELSAIYGIAHLFKDLMTTPYKHNGFKYIRENVRIKVIPILNPWGFNQSPKVYANSNGVNPNRNFNFEGSWDAYPNKPDNEWDYKGTSAFSEQETKNIANWLYYNKEIADFWIDFHTGYDDSKHDIWCLYQSYSPLASKIETAREKLVNRIKSKYSVTDVNNYAQIDYVNSIKIEWSEKAIGIPMMVVEQSPLNPKWKTGNYNNNGGAIREYATQAYVFLQELLSCDTVNYNLIDYLYTLRDDIFNNSCKQIPYYASSSYSMLINAGSTGSSSGGSSTVTETKDLKFNLGTVNSSDGSVTASDARVFSDFIQTTSFKITTNSTNFVFVCRCFDSNKKYIGTTTAFQSTGSYTLTSGTRYVVLLGKKSDESTISSSEVAGEIVSGSIKYTVVYDSTLALSGEATTTNYTVTNKLTNVTNSNSSVSVENGSSYIATLTASDGYSLGTVTITMGGSDITSTSYSNGSINISNVTGNIIITANANLIQTSNFALSETSISIKKGATKQLTATLDGADVTSSTNWSANNSNVTVVNGLVTGVTTGNSIITATKDSETATCSVNIVDNADSNLLTCTNISIASSNGAETSSTTRLSTDYIPITNTTGKMTINCSNDYYYTVRLYDSSKSYIGIITATDYPDGKSGWANGNAGFSSSSIKSNVTYVRLVFKNGSKGTENITTISGTVSINNGTEYTLTI